jgi:tRNA-dihydrouridine synthase
LLQIGSIKMDNQVVLAPIAGVCNSAFRLTVKEFGAGMMCPEMITDKGIVFQNEKSLNIIY